MLFYYRCFSSRFFSMCLFFFLKEIGLSKIRKGHLRIRRFVFLGFLSKSKFRFLVVVVSWQFGGMMPLFRAKRRTF